MKVVRNFVEVHLDEEEYNTLEKTRNLMSNLIDEFREKMTEEELENYAQEPYDYLVDCYRQMTNFLFEMGFDVSE